MAKIDTPRWDVGQSYIVRSKEQSYKGTSAGHEFLNGRAEVRGLDDAATDEEVARRVMELDWFVNSGYSLEKAEFLVKSKE